MAVPVSTITAITRTVVKTRNPNLWMDQDVFFRKKIPHVKTQAGERIQVPVRYQSFPAEWYKGLEPPDLSRREFETTAYYDWKLIRTPVVLAGIDILKNSGNENSLINIITAAIVNQEESQANAILTAFFGDNTKSTTINSFKYLINDGSDTLDLATRDSTTAALAETLGGINKSTETWWAGNCFSGSGTMGPHMDLLTDFWFTMQDGTNNAKMVASHPRVLGTVVKQNTSLKQYVNDAALTMGFTVYDFFGVPWYAQRHVGFNATGLSKDNSIFFIDTNHVEVTIHADRYNELEDFQKLANGQDGIFAMRMSAMELTTDDPSRSGVFNNFDFDSTSAT
jgi:hypothetical protein